MSRVIERADRQSTWSRAEVWHAWPLAWADRTSRSLLLVALAVAGLLSCYGLTLLLLFPIFHLIAEAADARLNPA